MEVLGVGESSRNKLYPLSFHLMSVSPRTCSGNSRSKDCGGGY